MNRPDRPPVGAVLHVSGSFSRVLLRVHYTACYVLSMSTATAEHDMDCIDLAALRIWDSSMPGEVVADIGKPLETWAESQRIAAGRLQSGDTVCTCESA